MAKYNIFYLHPCARTSAGWLKDGDINTAWVQSYRILCDSILMATLGEATNVLPGPSKDAHSNPYVKWCLQSCWNAAWMYSYYDRLSEINRDVFSVQPNQYRTNREIYETLKYIPQNIFTPPPLEAEGMICRFEHHNDLYANCSYDEFVRRFYLSSVKATSYRRIPRPWWAPSVGTSGNRLWKNKATQKPVKAKTRNDDEADPTPSGPGIDPADPYGIMKETP
jgi:hypothetical protein